jgi:hypothetical protein
MLALTTYPEPTNLLIDRAFFGLSTMTSAGPSPLRLAAPVPADFRPIARLERAAFVVAARFRTGAFAPAASSGRLA